MIVIKSKQMNNWGATYHINSIRYHRNGISGVGFFAVHFHFKDVDFDDDFIAVLEDIEDKKKEFGRCYVVMPSNPEQCMRGDYFESDLREIIEGYDKDLLHGLKKETPEQVETFVPEKPWDRFADIELF